MRASVHCLLAAALAVAPLRAQAPVPAPAAPAAKVHRVEKLTEHAYVIFGRGGNIGLFVTDHNAILVDDQFENLVPGLLEAIRSVTDKPLRYLVNTHVHGDHVGGNLALEKQGVTIVAHANVRKRLAAAQAKLDPGKRGGLPQLALGDPDGKRARLDLHVDGADFHLLHLQAGHTDGDIVFGYPAELVMHMGDLFFHGMLPFVDSDNGGSFEGLVAQIGDMAAWIPDGVKIIPGHGPVASRKDLLRYLELLKAVQAHAQALKGKSPAELAAAFDTKAWPDYQPKADFVTWETLFAVASGQGPGRVPRT